MAKTKAKTSADTAANLGFEAKLWLTADKLRNNMDAAEYKHVVLGLIFLKYISDAFEERHQQLLAEVGEGADPEDPDEYRADNLFWVPAEARSQTLQDRAKQPTIGKLIDEAMAEMLAPYKGRVYDPCCGSAGMFVQSEKFGEEHGGRIGDIGRSYRNVPVRSGHFVRGLEVQIHHRYAG